MGNEMKYPTKSRAVSTVGGLIKQLERLPKKMQLRGSFDSAVRIQVYNYSDSAKDLGLQIHCEIVEAY